ncbi:hypothetical protein NP233_g5422 [Leucocoprinus birnbaumii]|uniref:TPR-like protein n=1 Tax=Leucocoprinus birnbaumii TaxID=56174 RepID=A0AAD5VTB3_9AGAR|nr:hypothetical protein NP233_g5422 [Leucocoprinus birnbaumii]
MQADPASHSFFPSLCQRFQSLIWMCLDADLTKSAVFHAERYFAIDPTNHDSRHLFAIALLREGQTYSALNLVNSAQDNQCTGCLEIKARCCTALGRHRHAREALEATLQDTRYVNSAFNASRVAHPFPEEAALRCRAGNMALKGNLSEKAQGSYREALSSNPYLWEAFEGLCALGSFPEIDEIFPPRPAPVKATPQNEGPSKPKPTSTGVGFFTPDGGGAGNLFKAWKPEGQPQAFRIGLPHGPRDSLATNESSFYPLENSFHQPPPPNLRATRSQVNPPLQAHTSRPLSSADESGPVPKRLRSTSNQADAIKSKNSKLNADDPSKKARARPALLFANIFSSSGRRSQHAAPSRNVNAPGKGNVQPNPPTLPRRSSRLLSGPGAKQPHPSTKHTTTRDRRRQASNTRTVSAESDKDDDVFSGGDTNYLPSPPPPSAPLSPQPEAPSSPTAWSAAQEQHAQEVYENELAEYYIYDLIRRFATATRALAKYDCRKCLHELNQLPSPHQNTQWVLAMVGRAHFEQQDYSSAERAFKAVRVLEPHRLWDMEVYSTLLWHLQKTVDLSFLAQELLNINPQSPQAWIAIGNLFSLQKEKTQALACFRRAAQLDPACAYAYTLSGHESIDEDLDKAISYFQSALRADPRHYNAWYGLGTCYLRMSKVRLAEYHYRKALDIHPRNAVLMGCVGMAVERRGDRQAALELFDRAVRLAPENALVRYRRAKILVSMRKYEPAIQDLEELRMMTPEESNVVFQLAKVYRLVGNELKSAQLLAVARDISPKSANKIKKLLDTVKDELAGDDKMDEG